MADMAKFDKNRIIPPLPKQVAQAIEAGQMGPSLRAPRLSGPTTTPQAGPRNPAGASTLGTGQPGLATGSMRNPQAAVNPTLNAGIRNPASGVSTLGAEVLPPTNTIPPQEGIVQASHFLPEGTTQIPFGVEYEQPPPDQLFPQPARRIFTDQANAGEFGDRATIVQFNEQTGQNTYLDTAGNVVDPQFAPQDYAGGPSLRPFTPSQTPGLTITDSPVAVAGGGATPGAFSLRSLAQGGGGAAAPGGGGATAAGGGGVAAESAGFDLTASLEAGLPTVQAAYDEAVASGDPAAIQRAQLALTSHKADIARSRLADPNAPQGLDIEQELLRDLPTGNSIEAVIQRRRILSAIAGGRRADAAAETDRITAEGNFRRAAGGGKTPEELAKIKAETEKILQETRGIKVNPATTDINGNSVGGTIQVGDVTIPYTDQNLYMINDLRARGRTTNEAVQIVSQFVSSAAPKQEG